MIQAQEFLGSGRPRAFGRPRGFIGGSLSLFFFFFLVLCFTRCLVANNKVGGDGCVILMRGTISNSILIY